MKKLISILIVMMLCLSLIVPAYAAEDTFVPSISEKDGIALVAGTDENGDPSYGRILDTDGKVQDHIEEPCLVITPISKVNKEEDIPDASKQMLISVYNQLKDGTMEIPYDIFGADLDADNMVVRELIDVSWLCEEHPEMLENGATIELTFKLGVAAGDQVYVSTYKHDKWNPVVKTVNNGDGTVTCTFTGFCPVAFSVQRGGNTPPSKTGDDANPALWIALMAGSLVCLAAVVFFGRKSAKKEA